MSDETFHNTDNNTHDDTKKQRPPKIVNMKITAHQSAGYQNDNCINHK